MLKDRSKVKKVRKGRLRKRIAERVRGTAERPRVHVFKSNMYLYLQVVDDTANAVFESIVSRMQAGRTPEQAVAEEREASGARAPWLANVVVFQ